MPFESDKNKRLFDFFYKTFTYFFVALLSFPVTLVFNTVLDLNQKVEALTATGGTITTSGNYTIHTFTSSGTFTPSGNGTVEVLVVAGGGGGAGVGGGGGGGVVYHSSYSVTSSPITVTVGNGGAIAVNGDNSVFGSITALGGGRGGNWQTSGYSGGSGGGGGHGGTTTGGTKTQGNSGGGTGYGNNGGGNNGYVGSYPGGGGGGAGGAGGTATSNTTAGNGGAGFSSSISGTTKYYGAGGGSGLGLANGAGTAGTGGSGVGGNGAKTGSPSTSGAVNTGSGGGGGCDGLVASSGGSGIVIVRYSTPDVTPPVTTGAITSGTLGNNNWYTSANVKYTLTAIDTGGSGVASTVYCVDTTNTCTPISTYKSAELINVQNESATNYVRWRSTDVSGNVESIKSSGAIKFDKTGPSNPSIIINDGALTTSSAINILTLSADGNASGNYQMQFSCNNSNWTTAESYSTTKTLNITNAVTGCTTSEGLKTVFVRFIDLAGNIGSTANDSITYYSNFAPNTEVWDFSKASDYNYDSFSIDLISGKASLKGQNQSFRYLKVDTPTQMSSWLAWYEIEVYDSTGTKRTPTNITVSGGTSGSLVYDGDITTGWAANGYTGYVTLDFGSTISFSRIRLLPGVTPDPANMAHYLRISTDGSTWKDLVTINQSQYAMVWYDFSPTSSDWKGFVTTDPTIVNSSGTSIPYTTLSSFSETLGSGNQGTIKYQLSNNGTNFYWWNGSAWASASSYSTANTATDVNAHISTFASQVGTGNLYFKAYLHSSASTVATELDNISVGFTYITPPTISNLSPVFGSISGGSNITLTGSNFMPTTNATSFTNDANTVGLWYLNETSGATAYDSSSSGKNGTATGTTIVNGISGKARSFSGSDYITIGNMGNLPSQGTIEFWINSSALANYPNAFSTNLNGGNNAIRFEENSAGSFGVVVGNDGGTFDGCEYFPNSAIQVNTWYHIAYVWNISSNQEIAYLNGTPVCSGTHTLWPTTMPNVAIGSGFYTQRHWKGLIDEVRISNIARSNSDILLDANKTYKPTVTFGGIPATNVFAVNSTTITLTTPAHSDGLVDVAVTNPDGGIATKVNGFVFDGTPPSIPNTMTTSNEEIGEITGAFTVDIPSGSTDTGGSGLASYSLWKCDDITLETNCAVIASGILGTTVNVSGEFLPVEDSTFYYYWTSIDNVGNTSNPSTAKALTMNAFLPPAYTDTPTPTPTLTVTLTPIPGGTTIQNVSSGIVPVLVTDWNTNLETTAQSGTTTVGVEDTINANIKVAEMPVNFGSSPDWSGVTGATDENLAYFHSTQPISTITNGAATSYTLYIRKGEGDKVLICPGATSLSEVSLTCSGGYYLMEGETKNGATASVIMNGVAYWKVTGLTSTGGMSVLTGLRDTLSRLQVSEPSDHKITFGSTYGMIVGSTDTMEISMPDFDLSSITLSDIELTDSVGNARTLASLPGVNTWGVIIDSGAKTITFSVPTSGTGGYDAPSQIAIKIGTNAGGTNQISNPTSVGNKTITITLNNITPGEIGSVNIPIIDNDQVNITGYVTAYIHFDIDTATGEVPGVDPIIDCNYNACQTHQNGDPGTNYTVDLGELTSAVVNKSNSTSVAHTSGGNGIINSIYFDISTNAPSGAVVTVKSENGGLQGPGTNKIPSIGVSVGADGVTRADGDDIPANSGVYGYNLPVASSVLLGNIIPNSLCDSAVKYCGADTTTPKTVFTTNNLPVDTARVRMDLAAAANYTNNPGLYTDTLTFIATATY